MLKYTFSTREKFMIGVLILVALGFAWYQLLYMPIQGQITSLDSEIQQTQDEIVLRRTTAASIESQEQAIAEWEAQGLKPVFLPSFDNTKQLMAFLHGTLSSAESYSMSFDNPVTADDGTVHRSGTITFAVKDYASARSVVQAIAKGPYPCKITALGISDKSVTAKSKSGADVSVNMQVTFYERITADTDLKSENDKDEIQGNDWSQVINRDQA